MSIHYRFFPLDILIVSTLTVVCWLSTSAILYWTSNIYRSIELYELGYMLISDRMKYLLYQRTRRHMPIVEQHPFEQGLLFFSRPDFSNEINGRNDILRSQSTY